MRPEEIVDFAEALARISASGGGPKALAAHLAQATGGGVLLEEAQWRHLAAAGSSNGPSSTRVQSDAELLLRLTAAAIGAELARDAGGRRVTKGSLWSALLAGTFPDATAAREEAAAHGIALAQQYCVVLLEAEASETVPATAAMTELRALAADAFRAGGPELGLFERAQSLFVFVPAARAVDASNARTAAGLLPRAASRRKAGLRISGGVGSVEGLPTLARSGATSQAALTIGRRIFGGGHVAAYDELGAYPLLYEGADLPRLRTFASEVLAPLRSYDEKHQTELERTLKIYFTVGQNIKTASERLNVHRHTVFYRLRQIGEITSRSMESPHDQLTLRLAVAVDELHT